MSYVSSIATESGSGPIITAGYGTCATGAAATPKVVVNGDITSLTVGMTIAVKFTNANTASAPYLQVNSTTAYPIYYAGAAPSSSWDAGAVVMFTFTGSAWEIVGDLAQSSSSYTLPVATSSALGGIMIGFTASGKNYPVKLSNNKAYVNVPWSNTTYSAGTGLSISSTTINHSNSVTAGTIGSSSNTSGVSIAVPYATYDAQGHITEKGTHTHSIPAASSSANGYMSSSDKAKLDKYPSYVPFYYFTSKTVAAGSSGWTTQSDPDYTGYTYKAAINLGVTVTDYVPYVTFIPADISAYGLAPIASASGTYLYVYAETRPTAQITIPMIQMIYKGVTS